VDTAAAHAPRRRTAHTCGHCCSAQVPAALRGVQHLWTPVVSRCGPVIALVAGGCMLQQATREPTCAPVSVDTEFTATHDPSPGFQRGRCTHTFKSPLIMVSASVSPAFRDVHDVCVRRNLLACRPAPGRQKTSDRFMRLHAWQQIERSVTTVGFHISSLMLRSPFSAGSII
jgi:hypothetical protein